MTAVDTLLKTTTTTTTMTTTTTILPSLELLSITLTETFLRYLNSLDRLPGGQIILRYIKSSYKNDPVRSLFELALFIFAIHYFLSSKKKENKSELVKFSQSEINDLIEEWNPAPLIEPLTDLESWELKTIPLVEGRNGSHIKLINPKASSPKVLNLASNDYLNLNESPSIIAAARSVINTAGVGACGPPNFYGSQDVHVRLEEDLASYLETEQAILYGQDFVTAGSVIPAFLKRGDLVVADSGVNLAIQKALVVSRCDIEWYDHNDLDHLEEILSALKPVLEKQKPIRRRFIVTEGLFANTGDVALLPRIVELKNEYKYRLFLDESLSIGVLGKTGKGLAEYFSVPRSEISITIGSMANAFGSSGGFCVGVHPMIIHQRIQSSAYTFSASLPPYSAKVTSQAIKLITSTITANGNSKLINDLHDKTNLVHSALAKSLRNSNFVSIVSDAVSPVIHLALSPSYREKLGLPLLYGSDDFINTGKISKTNNHFDHTLNIESFILQKIIDEVLARSNVLISRSKLILEHENLPVLNPHLLINITTGASDEELRNAVVHLVSVINHICSNIRNISALETEIKKY